MVMAKPQMVATIRLHGKGRRFANRRQPSARSRLPPAVRRDDPPGIGRPAEGSACGAAIRTPAGNRPHRRADRLPRAKKRRTATSASITLEFQHRVQ